MRQLPGGMLISIVCPFYNEESAAAAFFDRLLPILAAAGEAFEIVCIDDGSTDFTLDRLLAARKECPSIRIVELSRNYGKEAALTAGLDAAKGDVVIPIDADLQDPPELIPALLEKWREGFEVVLAKRATRSEDGAAKRLSAAWYYRVHNAISDLKIPENVGDFRLMDRRVVEAIRSLPEHRRFMKGLFAWVGFRTTMVEYRRGPRSSGTSKFDGWRLWNFALEGITAFGTAPLRIWLYAGMLFALIAFSYAAFIVARTLVYGVDVPGYASLLTVVLMFGGLQMMGLGVLGEYLGRVYLEAKRRPVYIVRKTYE